MMRHVVVLALLASHAGAQNRDWVIGPFEKPRAANPVIAPNRASAFVSPMNDSSVHWEEYATFNPAAVVRDGKVYLMYRAEDASGDETIGHHTSRLGLAESTDGFRFTRRAAPVLFPARDAQSKNEWPGGVEDPRLVESDDGRYVLTYTQWNRDVPRLAVATSRDLIHWTKHGPAFAKAEGGRYLSSESKSGAIVSRVVGNRLIATKVAGRYWMYYGVPDIHLATSDNLVDWYPLQAQTGDLLNVLSPRKGFFDSWLVEAGPPALLTPHGIVVVYNAGNSKESGDSTLPERVYTGGQALFDANNPTKLIDRLDKPFIRPTEDYERTGQYAQGTTFVEALVPFNDKWLLYYGTADSRVGVAVGRREPAGDRRPTTQPNVVLILMDDLGYGDLGSYGARDIRTPNLDALARQGVRFTESYANAPVCTPTRAALISGRYQQRVGLEWALGGGPDTLRGLPVNGASLPALIKSVGYSTALIGKWHLGWRREFGPNAHGFDEFFGFLSGATDYYTHTGDIGRPDLYEDTTAVETPAYLTDEITRRAVAFIDRDRAGPFFLEVAYNAVHWPFEVPDLPEAQRVQRRLYQGPGDSVPATRHDYALMMERADRGVGEILRALDRHGLARNTLVIFTNDNGGEWLSRNAPFFHRKGTLWEGGIRVPLIMRWPAQLPAGRTSRQVAMTMDLSASILSAAGVAPNADRPLDGIDLIPLLRRGATVDRDVFWRIIRPMRQQRAVRSGPWKLLVDGAAASTGADAHLLLFDLRNDPGERRDLAAMYPQRVRRLRALIDAWERDVGSRY